MDTLLDAIKNTVRSVMRVIAKGLNKATGGKLSPNTVTILGAVAHIPIAYLITLEQLYLAAALLVFFGLFDTLDGELARLQNRASKVGMLLDSTTDRMKEVVLYSGIAYNLVATNKPMYAVWAIVALGASMLTSYINAMGDVVAGEKDAINKQFRGGLLRFEVRMFMLVVALLSNRLWVFVVAVAILASLTALQRLARITKKLS